MALASCDETVCPGSFQNGDFIVVDSVNGCSVVQPNVGLDEPHGELPVVEDAGEFCGDTHCTGSQGHALQVELEERYQRLRLPRKVDDRAPDDPAGENGDGLLRPVPQAAGDFVGAGQTTVSGVRALHGLELPIFDSLNQGALCGLGGLHPRRAPLGVRGGRHALQKV